MFLFWRLLLAHLTADFLLQPDWVFRIKSRHRWGVLLHGGIVGLTTFLLAAPYLSSARVITLLICALIIHIFQDKAKIIFASQVARDNLWTFLLDQFLHVLAMGLVALACADLPRHKFPFFSGVLEPLYANDAVTIFAIWFMILTYGMFVLQEYVKKSLHGGRKKGVSFPGFGMKHFSILSRGCIGIGVWAGRFSPFWYILPCLLLLVNLWMIRRGKLQALDFRISTVAAFLIGVLMRVTV